MNVRRIGYYGTSWGAMPYGGAGALAVEDRVKAAVLSDGGLLFDHFGRPGRDPLNYLPQIRIPVLMINGEYDAIFPLPTSQLPMFKLLGTPDEHKRHVLVKDSHVALIRHERMQETLNWFDRYLGPVEQSDKLSN